MQTSGWSTLEGERRTVRTAPGELGPKKVLLILTIVGLALRAVLAGVTQHFRSPELAYIQADSYMPAAVYLRQFGHIPNPLYVPAYIELCAWLQRLFPTHALMALISLQVILDTACIPLTYLLAEKTLGARVALPAAVIVTFDSLLVVQPALVLTEALYIPLLLVAVLLFVYGYLRPKGDGLASLLYVGAGFLAGVGALTRSVGLVIPIVFSLIILFAASRSWAYRVGVVALLWVPFAATILPSCWGNKVRYGHFSLSTSREFNMAVLMVGPAKASTMPFVGPNLLDMWAAELGPGYMSEPPYVVADRASAIAVSWAKGHPGLVLRSVVKGQLEGFVAPNRRSWTAVLAWLHLSARSLQVFYLALAGTRVLLALLAGACLVRWRELQEREPSSGVFLILFVLLIFGHIAGAGAVVMGRYFCPVAPYLDILAAGTLSLWVGTARSSEKARHTV